MDTAHVRIKSKLSGPVNREKGGRFWAPAPLFFVSFVLFVSFVTVEFVFRSPLSR